MESGSPRILPALADRTHFYHAVSGQFPATAQQCVNKNDELPSRPFAPRCIDGLIDYDYRYHIGLSYTYVVKI